ncbi:MAG: tripeptide aminopeptidase [Erysipelotrichaceae bacterium]|nr:MAG: tripeptide [Erysipelotrichaceae bacterium]TXT19189.1 MAG: tripeptide aminopeptidase [Erysipelotrichaceae bacterium]
MENLLERFIRYAKINTRSDENSKTVPSTLNQVEFAKMLANELKGLGLSDVKIHPINGFVCATLPANTDKVVDSIGFIAHIDTADFNSENIQPQVISNYDGLDIVLNKDQNIVLSPALFPSLLELKGHTLITTDGTTLLGADDKAGVCEIIEAMIYLMNHTEIKHGEIKIAFGPDEEIGRGADLFDVKDFNTAFAYTLDGAVLGELEYESFNAAKALVKLHGVSVHPGGAKDKMISTSKLAMEFDSLLPQSEVPEHTEGKEGFYFLSSMKTEVEEGEMHYIIRDHDKAKFLARKEQILKNAAYLNDKYGANRFEVILNDQYFNMKDVIQDDMRSVDLALKAMKNLGIESKISAIRGGTDGSKISFMGIPTPNLFTGGGNYHGKYEYVSYDVMQRAVETIVEIVRLHAES